VGGGRRWKQPNISSLSRGRGKLAADPVRMLFEHAAGPAGADGAPGVFCCGLRVVSMDGSVTDVPDSKADDAFFGRPSNQSRDGLADGTYLAELKPPRNSDGPVLTVRVIGENDAS
jgi:hypothetical protein